ncbi:peptidyl-prolyl cis-trans isomerase [uncultured Mediterranea sp.]|uniref:peptidyl-prolyl cis-trans isomerase n=1 Tax=uncultured Mediterranea sp. TaxID=1926662 RepID=UPI00258A3089|nr:peptidyl-prolyl cis-trans isomerase [uncultured Mediterranea sp.]
MRNICLLGLMMLLAGACGKPQYDHKGRTPLVELDGNFLYQEDLAAVQPVGQSKDDSLLFAEHYIRNWAEDILLYEKAQNNIPDNAEIEQLVKNYRKALIMHVYQQSLIQEKLAEEITEADLQTYYDTNKDVFKAEAPLMKGLFIKVPLTSPGIGRVRQWYKDERQSAVEHLEKYSLQNAVKYEYFYDKWIPASEILSLMPLREEKVDAYFAKNRHVELKDTAYWYFLNVSDYIPTGGQEPYEAARSAVSEMVVNRKQVEFLNQVKGDLYNEAVEDGKLKYCVN